MPDNEDNLEEYKKMIDSFLCTDLKDLLGCFNLSKAGLKIALKKRSKELLETKNAEVNKKILEIYNARIKSKQGNSSPNKPEADEGTSINKNQIEMEKSHNINSNDQSKAENQNTLNTEFQSLNNATSKNMSTTESSSIPNRNSALNSFISQTLSVNSTNILDQIRVTSTNDLNSRIEMIRNQLFPVTERIFESHLSNVTNSIQTNRDAISEKFKQMQSYKYIGELEDASLIMRRNSSNDLCYKSVICLNKLKTDDLDFTKFYHVDRNLLIDFFRNKKYEIHLRIGFNSTNVYIPSQIRIELDRRPFYFSKYDNIQSVNLTPYFTRFYKTFNPISFEIADHNNRKTYYCGIYVFKKLTSSDLLKNHIFNPINSINCKPSLSGLATFKMDKLSYVKSNCNLNAEKTIQMIKEKLRPVNSDFEIETNFIKISLICPLTKLRIKIPSRGKMCKHVQCFDLESYILLNEKSEKWLCPICDICIIYTNLIIDKFSKEIIEKCKNNEEVKVDADGKLIEENIKMSSLEHSINSTIQIDDISTSDDSIKITKTDLNDSCIILD